MEPGGLPRRPALRDPALDAALADHGYVIVDDFLSPDEIAELRAVLDRSVGDQAHGLVFSNEIADPAVRAEVEQGIGRIVGPHLLAVLADYRLAASLFVLKLRGEDSRRIWHADPALVDERRFTSVSAWCPLSDVDEGNGAFTVAEGSHRIIPAIRGGVRVQGLLFPSEPEVDALCTGPRTVLSMTAGQALLYDHRLAHGSPPNRTADRRWAVNVPGIPVEAPLVHYIREPDGSIDVYQLPDDYFWNHDASIAVAEDPRAQRVATIAAGTETWGAPADR